MFQILSPKKYLKSFALLFLALALTGCQAPGTEEGATAKKERPAKTPYCSRSAQARGVC